MRSLSLHITYIFLFIFLYSKPATGQDNQADTLSVVNWNLEFFGDNSYELPEEMTKTLTIMNQLNADVYGLVEVVNIDSLRSLVQSMNGGYSFIVSPFGSQASNPNDANYDEAQKLAFIYRQSVVKNVSGRALLKTSSTAYYNWASGRFPYLVSAEVFNGNIWQPVKFVIIHGKAYTDNSSCNRRYYGGMEMKDTLDKYYANHKVIILGDYNDDFDESICSSFNESNYSYLVKDSLDAVSYRPVTLPLSIQGLSTISGYPGFLDHVVINDELASEYIPKSAKMLKDEVNNWVSDYTNDVSDHYPVITKYRLSNTTSVANFEIAKNEYAIYPNPSSTQIFFDDKNSNFTSYDLLSLDGRKILSGLINDKITAISLQNMPNGTYFIKIHGNKQQIITEKIIVIK